MMIVTESVSLGLLVGVIQIVLSIGLLGLAVAGRRRVSETAEISDKLKKLTGELSQLSAEFVPVAKPVDSREACRIEGILRAYEKWATLVPREKLSSAVSKEIQAYKDDLSKLLEQARVIPEGSQILDQMLQWAYRAVLDASLKSDQDFEPERGDTPLQRALSNLMESAGLEFICPKRGSTFTRPGDGVVMKVDSVTTRGVRDRSGDRILREPEVRPLR